MGTVTAPCGRSSAHPQCSPAFWEGSRTRAHAGANVSAWRGNRRGPCSAWTDFLPEWSLIPFHPHRHRTPAEQVVDVGCNVRAIIGLTAGGFPASARAAPRAVLPGEDHAGVRFHLAEPEAWLQSRLPLARAAGGRLGPEVEQAGLDGGQRGQTAGLSGDGCRSTGLRCPWSREPCHTASLTAASAACSVGRRVPKTSTGPASPRGAGRTVMSPYVL